MPIVRLSDLREMTPEQREAKLTELRTEMVKMNTLINAGGSVESPGKAKAYKKAIAKVMTVINEEAHK